MRVTIRLESNKVLKLPIHYNHIIQGFIYDNISDKLASFLHEKGYIYGKRRFKLFTFSRLYGRFRLNGEFIFFRSPLLLHLSSFDTYFIQEFAEGLLTANRLNLSGQELRVNSIEVHPNPKFDEELTIYTLSPITVYSTLNTGDGRKKTYYYSPHEREFSRLIRENLKKKFNLIHHKEAESLKFLIEPLSRRSVSEKIIKYKGTVIKGWMGRFKIKGSPPLISVAYDTGLGAKNSQGFGMFEIKK
jgi:CRISPR-associated endoribonuclease Cas6